jgi:hypothetical protein
MEDFSKVEHLVDHVRDYMQVRADEVRLGVAERASGVIASLVSGAFITVILVVCYIFVGIGAALLLGRIFDDWVAGFLIIALIQLVLGLLVWGLRQRLIRIPVMNAILHQLLVKKADHEQN